MKSVMQHSFSRVPQIQAPRSVFDRSHGHKTTFNSMQLVPIICDEILPGDTIKLRHTIFGRLSTPIVPIMDNLFLDVFYFFVPTRLVWSNFQRMMGEQATPGASIDFLVPQIFTPQQGGFGANSLADYFGMPTQAILSNSATAPIATFHRAYNRIVYDWFRNENISDPVVLNTGDGPDSVSDYPVRNRCKRPDYFTSCLPWPQKGVAVELPLGASAPVFGNGLALGLTDGIYNVGMHGVNNYYAGYEGALGQEVGESHATGNILGATTIGVVPKSEAYDDSASGLYADLSSATAPTINSIREAFQLQKLFERDARGGTRYIEIIRSHFGVISPDARLQRSEFLGMSSQRININPVQQTSATDLETESKTPLGTLGAYGVVSSTNGGFTKSFVEHGVIVGIANVRADITYQQGLHRKFTRREKLDYYWPSLAHLGEQAVYNREILCQGLAGGGDEHDALVWGYQERFAEYRYFPSQVTGLFRTDNVAPLHYWHLSEYFAGLPELNDDFLTTKPPLERCLAITDGPEIFCDIFFDYSHARAMPVFSVPGNVDHF